jgi:hypothetical protein
MLLANHRGHETKNAEANSGNLTLRPSAHGEFSMKLTLVFAAALCAAVPFLSGCASTLKASEYSRSELGEITRAESATVLSQRYVKLKNWRGGDRRSARRNGINYIIKIDRTGETLSVTQTDDVSIATGASAWVEFGDRIRLAPRN